MEPIWQVRFRGEVLFLVTDTQRKAGYVSAYLAERGVQRTPEDLVEYVLHLPLINPNSL
jgi:hypothetical protein